MEVIKLNLQDAWATYIMSLIEFWTYKDDMEMEEWLGLDDVLNIGLNFVYNRSSTTIREYFVNEQQLDIIINLADDDFLDYTEFKWYVKTTKRNLELKRKINKILKK